MIKISSIDTASYITLRTGEIAEVVISNGGLIRYQLKHSTEVIDTYYEYVKAEGGRGELSVNIVEYNFIRDKYLKELELAEEAHESSKLAKVYRGNISI